MQRKKERRAAGSVQAGDSNQTGRLGKIQGWLEPLLLSCTLSCTAGACTGLQVPQHACKSLRAVPGANQSLEGPENVKEMPGAQACGWRHMDCARHLALCS